MKDPDQIKALDRWMRLQPNMPLKAVSERQYYEDQAGPVAKTIRLLPRWTPQIRPLVDTSKPAIRPGVSETW